MGYQTGIERHRFTIDKERVTITKGQIRQPTAEKEAILPGITHSSNTMIMEMAIVSAGNGCPS
jgi:hypothetical protein